MPKRHLVQFTEDQRAELDRWEAGPLTRRQRNRAPILLRADAGEIGEAVGVSLGTVANVRRRFAEGGLAAAIHEKPRPGARLVLDGKAEAIVIVIATACSPVPEGRATWRARMIADRLVELQVVESVSKDTILRVLNKASSSRGRRSRGACRRG